MKLTDTQKQLIDSYGDLIVNTGGNDIKELVEREGVTYFNNPVLAEIQGSVCAQILLLERLYKNALLSDRLSG
jgi:hypothetical protein